MVNVAGPYRIASIYIVLFVPILVAWAFYYHYGQQVKHYALLLPVTMCCATVGFDLVNQFTDDNDLPEIQLRILITDEYAGF